MITTFDKFIIYTVVLTILLGIAYKYALNFLALVGGPK